MKLPALAVKLLTPAALRLARPLGELYDQIALTQAAEWRTVQMGNIRASEDVCYLRVVQTQQTCVKLEDGKVYLSDFAPLPGEIVLAHVPLDGCGYISPA